VFCLWLANKEWEKFFYASITPGKMNFFPYAIFAWFDALLYQWLLTQEREKALSFREVIAYLDRNRR